MIRGTTKLLGVIGYPVEHSFSPVMHNAAIAELGEDYVYLPFPIQHKDLNTALSGFAAIGVEGFSVTIPHKQTIIPLLSEVSTVAQAVGAVNTVWRKEKGWGGTNTDVVGFITPLQAYDVDWESKKVVILGNGGAARAVVAGCSQLGFNDIHVVGRNYDKLAAFQTSWLNSPMVVQVQVHLWDELSALIAGSDLLVNTTPVGMFPQVNQSPVTETVMNQLKPGTIVYDLIYRPSPTQFLKFAEVRGAVTIDGLEMLVQQGATALQMWLKQPVPIEVMRQSLQQQLE
ncbi:MAG: shikimate dehydrogenase [Microcoleaceae cyanobacterium]